MPTLWYVTHPEVRIEAQVPVGQWGLNERGLERARAACAQPWMASVERIISSDETKALELAAIVAVDRGLPIEVRPAMAETDRERRGFLPPDEYAPVSEEWFANPVDAGTTQWEPAAAVQQRVLDGLADVFAGDQSVLVAGHGGSGTLLWCALTGTPIASEHDQPFAGHYFRVDLATRQVVHGWRAVDDLEPATQ